MLEFDKDFLKDEVRDGFYISGKIKRCWASQLVILDEIDKICRKHGIQYFAEWGTLLGTVRHGGYIPWDDDLDICMKRSDYDRFVSVANNELPDEYVCHTCDGEYDYWDIMAKVANTTRINFDNEFLEKHYGCPYAVGIDIFPLDYIAPTKEQEKAQYELINLAMFVGDKWSEGVFKGDLLERSLIEIEQKVNKSTLPIHFAPIHINRNKNIRKELYLLADKLFGIFGPESSDKLGQIGIRSSGFDGSLFDARWYSKAIYRPFENFSMPIPIGYEAVLRGKYGEYMKLVKNGGASTHDYPCFSKQEERLRKEGIRLPVFDLPKEPIPINTSKSGDGLSENREVIFLVTNIEELNNIAGIYKSIVNNQDIQNFEPIVVLIPYYQKDFLGNFVESYIDFEEVLEVCQRSGMRFVLFKDYDFESRHPYTVYLQCPYDEYHDTFSIHPDFYSSVICQYTDNLIYYSPYDDVDEDFSNPRSVAAMRSYVAVPGLLNATRVLVRDERQKKDYVSFLTELTGEGMRSYWEEKIYAKSEEYCDRCNALSEYLDNVEHGVNGDEIEENGVKKLLYNVSPSFILEYGEDAIRKIKETLSTLISCEAPIMVDWLNDVDTNELRGVVDDSVLEAFEVILNEAMNDGIAVYASDLSEQVIENASAFYGSSGLVAHKMRMHGKPVMIQSMLLNKDNSLGYSKVPADFLLEETRDGFVVPSAIKQAWAAELEVLIEIDRVCKKHDIQYFADWGTLLGAVRHGGYIPWDDDLDIVMKRKDYQKFIEVASKELETGFFVQTYENMDPDNWLFMGKVVGKNHICYEKEHLRRFHNFPFIACVDVFVLDYVYKDEEKEQRRRDLCLYLLAVSDAIVSGKLVGSEIDNNLKHIEDKWGVFVKKVADPIEMGRSLYREVEHQFAMVSESESDYLSQLFPWGLKGKTFQFPKEYYEKAIRLPFEMTTIPVPQYFNTMLKKRYGYYLKAVKNAGAHDYPYFESQKKRFEDSIDMKLPSYSVSKEEYFGKKEKYPEDDSLKNIVSECLNEMNRLMTNFSENVILKLEEALNVLNESQQLAIDLGNMVEKAFSGNIIDDSSKVTVDILSEYCEKIYEVYMIVENALSTNVVGTSNSVSEENEITNTLKCKAHELVSFFENMKAKLIVELIEKKNIVFLTTNSEDYKKGIDLIYQDIYWKTDEEKDSEEYRLLCFPLRSFYKDYDGSVKKFRHFLDEVENIQFERLSLIYPAKLYITFPYDSWNEAIGISPELYSEQLWLITRELVWLDVFNSNDFTKVDERDFHNLDYYLTKPGVINADRIVVNSDILKETYAQKLAEFVNGTNNEDWEKKIDVVRRTDEIKKETGKNDNKKRLLYGISLGCVFERGEQAIDKIKHSLDIIKMAKNKLDVDIILYPSLSEDIRSINPVMFEKTEQFLEEQKKFNHTLIIEYNEAMKGVACFDAYYGDGCPLVPKFERLNKPIMIQDYDI